MMEMSFCFELDLAHPAANVFFNGLSTILTVEASYLRVYQLQEIFCYLNAYYLIYWQLIFYLLRGLHFYL